MATKIYVNLPVKNLERSVAFFQKLGFSLSPQFTDETAACIDLSDDIHVMLLSEALFKEFTPKAICDATKSTEVLVSLSCESRKRVDELVSKAVSAGGTTYCDAREYGFMYSHGFQDLDSHIWELVYMEPKVVDIENAHAFECYAQWSVTVSDFASQQWTGEN